MGKKSRLKAERANVAPMTDQPGASSWAGPLVTCLGIAFILTSLVQLATLLDFAHYRYLFQDSSEAYVLFRYLISCSARFMGLAVGFGLCFRREWFRKAALFLAWGTVAVAYWKHPYLGFLRHLRLVSSQMESKGLPFSPENVIQYVQAWNISWFTESTFAWFCVVIIILTEIFIALVVVFILTRPSVKPVFR